MRIKVGPDRVNGAVVEFRMEEHGDVLEGVMTRYKLPSSAAARTMLDKFDEIFFGGNFVALAAPAN